MRLFKLGVYYSGYLQQFYTERPTLGQESYTVQHAALIADRVASSDFWTSALRRLGYETCDTIANAEPLQRAWAQEHGTPFNDHFLFEVTRAQVTAFQPSILLVADYSHFGPAFLQELRDACPSIRLVVGWCGAPYPDLQVMRSWDMALSCIPEMVEEFRSHGLDAHHVNHGFAPAVLDQLRPRADVPEPFTFLGSIFKAPRFHGERERIISTLFAKTPLSVWSDVPPPPPSPSMNLRLRQLAYDTVSLARRAGVSEAALVRTPVVHRVAHWVERPGSDGSAIDPAIRRRAHRPLFGLPMFQQLRDSDLTLNTHIDVSPRSASNMRLFEGTGVGTCLLTDWKDNIRDLFEPDTEVVTYRSADEAVDKYRYLRRHPAERAAIAAAGQRRTHRDHNFDKRAAVIDAIIRRRLGADERVTPLSKVSAGRPPSSYVEVERAEHKFYLDVLRDGMMVFDVGANVGELTLLFSRFVGSGSVHAFEASSVVHAALSTVVSAAQRRNVVLNHLALSDRPGTVPLHCYDGPYASWNSSALRPLEKYGINVKSTRTESSPATTVDLYCAEHRIAHIDLLKVDVEGAELQVLRGARAMLQSRAIACVTFEFGQTTFDMGNVPADIEALLDDCGYSVANLIEGEPTFPGGDDVATAQFAMHVARPRA